MDRRYDAEDVDAVVSLALRLGDRSEPRATGGDFSAEEVVKIAREAGIREEDARVALTIFDNGRLPRSGQRIVLSRSEAGFLSPSDLDQLELWLKRSLGRSGTREVRSHRLSMVFPSLWGPRYVDIVNQPGRVTVEYDQNLRPGQILVGGGAFAGLLTGLALLELAGATLGQALAWLGIPATVGLSWLFYRWRWPGKRRSLEARAHRLLGELSDRVRHLIKE